VNPVITPERIDALLDAVVRESATA
jgi:hypothetical protein